MKKDLLKDVKLGLMLAGLFILFGICMGISFGIFEDVIKGMVRAGVDTFPLVHANDQDVKYKIWRWWQRSHFHAVGIGAFTMAMIAICALSTLTPRMKRIASTLIGLGGLYSISWLLMALLAPEIGRKAAHHAPQILVIVYISVGSLLCGMGILFANIIFDLFKDKEYE